MEKIGEGAEAKTYKTKIFGADAIVKYREEKRYRIAPIDISLRQARTKKEFRIMLRAAAAGISVPKVFARGKFSIYMQYISGKLLKDTKINAEGYGKIGSMLAALHALDIAHGDYTPANIVVSGNDLLVIDFGLADTTKSVEDKAIDLLLMKRSLNAMQYKRFIEGYTRYAKNGAEMLRRLAEIEKRGRYKIRTLAVV